MRARDLLPWRNFIIETSWPPAVVRTELGKQMDAPRLLGARGNAPFVGKAESPDTFRFRRIIGYANAFLPRIVAVVEASHHDGSRLRVRMRLPALVAAFMSLWMTLATLGGIASAVACLVHGEPAALIGLLLPVFGACIVGIPFALEARIAERLLRDLFATAPALPAPPETGEAYR